MFESFICFKIDFNSSKALRMKWVINLKLEKFASSLSHVTTYSIWVPVLSNKTREHSVGELDETKKIYSVEKAFN